MAFDTFKQFLSGFLVAAIGATVLADHPAQAKIIWESTTGQIEKLESPFWLLDDYSATPRKTFILAFDEAQNIVLPRDIQISDSTNWDKLSDLDVIPKGTRVSSHFIYFWNPNPSQGRIEARATITFDEPIIGLMGDRGLIVPTNDLFFPNDRGVSAIGTLDEPPLPRDIANITGDRGNVLEVYFTNHSQMDSLRVITQAPVESEPIMFLDIRGK
ncbi:MAG: hypothetical protein RID09_30115 [Coleofasciculus sp. G1-WW12-02]|uniref:hypothetical protein n=1 Tax=Coleofasciculus sp. G1-WW12-02 TaxID=3068483 RepID=UPI0032F91F28